MDVIDSRPALSRRTWVMPAIGTLARLLLAAVFAMAGLAKLTDLDVAVLSVKSYQLLPDGVAEILGIVLPVLEVALALLLLVGLGTRLVAVGIAVLLVVFIGGIASLWIRGMSIGCGCFGSSLLAADSPPSYVVEIVRDLGLLVAAGWLIRWPRTCFSFDSWLTSRELT